MGELIGLNHIAIESTMNIMNVDKKKRKKLFDNIKIMESAALEVIREQSKDK